MVDGEVVKKHMGWEIDLVTYQLLGRMAQLESRSKQSVMKLAVWNRAERDWPALAKEAQLEYLKQKFEI